MGQAAGVHITEETGRLPSPAHGLLGAVHGQQDERQPSACKERAVLDESAHGRLDLREPVAGLGRHHVRRVVAAAPPDGVGRLDQRARQWEAALERGLRRADHPQPPTATSARGDAPLRR